MTPEQTFGQLLGPGKSWRLVEARFESEYPTFLLKVGETAAVWPEECARGGTSVPTATNAVVAPERLQQGVHDRLCAGPRTSRRRRQGVLCTPRPGRGTANTSLWGSRPLP